MCTDFLLKAADGSVVNGRSMEFGAALHSEFIVIGRGTPMHSTTPQLAPGLKWTCQYGVVGMNAFGTHIVTDGMNEAGLSVGCLWLPGITHYASTVRDPSRSLLVGQVANWLLSSFATTAEVRENFSSVEIWGDKEIDKQLPLHFAVHDKNGNSLVIEFTDPAGKPVIYDNTVGVLTNAPAFPWQLTNLETYVGLQAQDAEPITIGGKTFNPPGHGSGMRGLPGDSTPPSRFVRTVYQKQFATQPADVVGARNLALHLLNTVDIPKGSSASLPSQRGKVEDDYTQWAVVKALSARTFGVRTYDNTTLMEVDLRKIDLGTPGERTFPVPGEPVSIDISSKLQPQ
jgi:choloylglycine hydrolase